MLLMIYMSLVDDEDIPAFERLYEQYKDIAFQKAVSILKDADLAEDCIADVFLSVAQNFQKIHNLKSYEQRKYIVISSRNCALNILKKSKNEKYSTAYDEVSFNNSEFSGYSAVEWNESIRQLNQTDLDILYQVFIQGISYRQIAASYGISYAAAKQRLWTAKNNLKRILLEKGDEK